MAKCKMQELEHISIDLLKLGNFVQIEEDDEVNLYVVIRRGQQVRFYPLGKDYIEYSIYSIKTPTIKNVFDGRNGDCLFHKIDKQQAQEDEDFEKFIGDYKEDENNGNN